MTEKMGFETNRRIVKVYNNQRVTATIAGQLCHFRSKFEYAWAKYQQFLQDTNEIMDWFYEPEVFYFENETTAPVQYTPDFQIIGKKGDIYYQECKGYHDGQTNKKLQRMAKHHPDIVMELVLQSIPKNLSKGANRRRVAAKYCRRIIDAGVIFKQIKGLVNLDPPIGE